MKPLSWSAFSTFNSYFHPYSLHSSLAEPAEEAFWTKGPKFTSDTKNISSQASFLCLALHPGNHWSFLSQQDREELSLPDYMLMSLSPRRPILNIFCVFPAFWSSTINSLMRYYSWVAIFKGQDVRVVSIHTAGGCCRGLGPKQEWLNAWPGYINANPFSLHVTCRKWEQRLLQGLVTHLCSCIILTS